MHDTQSVCFAWLRNIREGCMSYTTNNRKVNFVYLNPERSLDR